MLTFFLEFVQKKVVTIWIERSANPLSFTMSYFQYSNVVHEI